MADQIRLTWSISERNAALAEIPTALRTAAELARCIHHGLALSRSLQPGQEPVTPTERVLARVWAEVLHLERVGRSDHFLELGGDSVSSLIVVQEALNQGVRLRPKDLSEFPVLADCAAAADRRANSQSKKVAVGVEPTPATPSQRLFLELVGKDAPDTQDASSSLYAIPEGVDVDRLRLAFLHVQRHHDALRMRHFRSGSQWMQSPVQAEPTVWQEADLRSVPPEERPQAIAEASRRALQQLSMDAGRLMTVAHLRLTGGDRLFVAYHYLAADVTSHALLLNAFERVLAQLKANRASDLALQGPSFLSWAKALRPYAQSPAVREELSYWRSVVGAEVDKLPVDFEGPNSRGSVRGIGFEASRRAAHPLRESELVAAVSLALQDWAGLSRIRLWSFTHGRIAEISAVNAFELVGRFATPYPILVALPRGTVEAAAAEVEAALRKVPNGGLNYGLLSGADPDSGLLESYLGAGRPEVWLNYRPLPEPGLERLGELVVAPEPPEPAPGKGIRPAVLSVTVRFARPGVLSVRLGYSSELYREARAQQLAERIRARLSDLDR